MQGDFLGVWVIEYVIGWIREVFGDYVGWRILLCLLNTNPLRFLQSKHEPLSWVIIAAHIKFDSKK